MEEQMDKKKELTPKTSETKSKLKQVDRVALNENVITRIDEWISQIETTHPALQLSRTDMANFIVMAHALELSNDELGKLKNSHFNAVRFSKWITLNIKNATKRGEKITQEELLQIYMSGQKGDLPCG